MTIREKTEELELKMFSKYASFSRYSLGRERETVPCEIRTEYQRDRDRILHSKSFRRLKQKTQVFLTPEGDHYRTRLTHTLEVSQLSRTIAKALRLNEDLADAIALGHDLGHTPFGHAGERALNKICTFGFAHNEQSVRVVEFLEKKGQGLNLTWEVIDGILNHKSSGTPHTLEGQIVRLSDKMAYINHDIDDSIRGGILRPEDIPKEFTDVLGTTSKMRLNTMIHDVITNSMDQPEIRMSKRVENATKGLREFLFENVYKNPLAKGEEEKAINMIKNLYQYYVNHIDALPAEFYEMLKNKGASDERIVCDYIAGMTDTYAVKKFQEFFVPESWKI